MSDVNIKRLCLAAALFVVGFVAGCEESVGSGGSKLLGTRADLGATIGSLAEIYSPESVAVEGYGLVGGLRGTGSSECPPQLRAYLKRYIVTQLPEHRIDVDKLIDSHNTAIVLVEGGMPALTAGKRDFDVRVTPLKGTQTISLEGGWLYGAELRVAGRAGMSTRPVGNVGGAVFIDKIGGVKPDRKTGYVLGGAKGFQEYRMHLILHKPDFEITSVIRNRINERFGFGVAKALAPGRIELTVPLRYRGQGQRFVSIVKATYLTEDPEITRERIMTFVRELAVLPDKYVAEMALEAIGNDSLGKLAVLLNSSNEQVRLHAARCMLNLRSGKGLGTLIDIALDKASGYRIEALEALTGSAQRNDAVAVSRRLLRDPDFQIRLTAYEQLRRLDDIAATRESIAGSFYLEQIPQTPHKGIFVSRSGKPRIVIFGAPISCRDNIFIQSEDGTIMLNAPSGQSYVSVMRKHPTRTSSIMQLKSSFDLADIIRVLCSDPPKKDEAGRGGLGVSYAEMIALVEQMSDKGAIRAAFHAGPLPKIRGIVKK